MDSLQYEILVINLQSEEIIFENTQGSKNFNALSSFKKHSVDDLGVLVQNYQQGDSLAAEQLRQKFYPLISKLSHRHSMYSIFGEDAENMAWLLFYEFIYDYKGDDFQRLPGLVRRFLIFRLLRLMEQEGARWDTEESLESDNAAEETAECELLQKLTDDIVINQVLSHLPRNELRVIEEYYYKDKTQKEVALTLKCDERSIRRYQKKAIGCLKRKLKI